MKMLHQRLLLLLVALLLFGAAGAPKAQPVADPPRAGSRTASAGAPSNGLPIVTLHPIPYSQEVPFPEIIPDPIESFNRAMHGFNDVFIQWIVNPASKGYRAVVGEPVRRSIRKAGDNLGWPKRLFGNLLQAKWKGAAVETARFVTNTTVGLLGFFDPARRMGLEPSNEDFGQAFGAWGAGPGFYITLPFLGPYTGRDTLALPFDMVTDGAAIIPGLSTLFSFNKLSFLMPTYQQVREVQKDPYFYFRDISALMRKADVMDFTIDPDAEKNPSQTLGLLFLGVKDPKFVERGREFEVRIPTTDRKMPYTLWAQDHPAPLVFLLPGVATHRMSESNLALAEIIYARGMSVVTISSTMNWEFMETAGTVAVPGYAQIDAWDTYIALNAVYNDLFERYREQFTRTALVGFSLGGLHTLFISSFETTDRQRDLKFDRYIAINPPVDVIYALTQLDSYYNAPLEWNEATRRQRIEETLFKAIRISQSESDFASSLTPADALPFTETESKYLIGLSYRLILRDIIYSSQRRRDMGVLQTRLGRLRREPVYKEIAEYSYIRYVNDFVIPYYLTYSGMPVNREELLTKTNLWSLERDLAANQKLRVSINENDFLLRQNDIDWLDQVLGPRLVRFKEGGHLGNLYLPSVQDEILKSLDDLK